MLSKTFSRRNYINYIHKHTFIHKYTYINTIYKVVTESHNEKFFLFTHLIALNIIIVVIDEILTQVSNTHTQSDTKLTNISKI